MPKKRSGTNTRSVRRVSGFVLTAQRLPTT
jgi:hypothetical protein